MWLDINKQVQKFYDVINYSEYQERTQYNDMNQWHNLIQDGAYGWKEAAD